MTRKDKEQRIWEDQVLLNEVQHDFNNALDRKAYDVAHEIRICRSILIERYIIDTGEHPVQDPHTKFWR